MKQKILILFLVSCFSFLGFTSSQYISLAVSGASTVGNGCIVPINVFVDTEGQEISAVDLMMETSLVYKDFVPSSLFPYFLPPVVRSNGLLHVVGFTVDPSERIVGSGLLGTLYLGQKDGFLDGAIRLFFLGEGNTTDSNLSKVGGVDALKRVGDANVIFSADLPACTHNAAIISGGFAGVSYQDSLSATMQKIHEKYASFSLGLFLQNNIFFVIALLLLIIIVIATMYRKSLLSYFHKDLVGKKHTS